MFFQFSVMGTGAGAGAGAGAGFSLAGGAHSWVASRPGSWVFWPLGFGGQQFQPPMFLGTQPLYATKALNDDNNDNNDDEEDCCLHKSYNHTVKK